MNPWLTAGLRAAVSGTIASVLMAATLAALARREGKGAAQPLNATSHWLHGERASAIRHADLPHTALGYATHHASAWLWALLFERWLTDRPPHSSGTVLRKATLISALAAGVDYGLTPKRLTPGWENVLSKGAMALTYVAMALGLVTGALLNRGR
jgi:hypothetical protein